MINVDDIKKQIGKERRVSVVFKESDLPGYKDKVDSLITSAQVSENKREITIGSYKAANAPKSIKSTMVAEGEDPLPISVTASTRWVATENGITTDVIYAKTAEECIERLAEKIVIKEYSPQKLAGALGVDYDKVEKLQILFPKVAEEEDKIKVLIKDAELELKT